MTPFQSFLEHTKPVDPDFNHRHRMSAMDSDDLSRLTLKQLREKAEEQALHTSGTKAQLIKRLEDAKKWNTLAMQIFYARDNRNWGRRLCQLSQGFPSHELHQNRLQRYEEILANLRARQWREAAAMSSVGRLAQRDGVPRSRLADLDPGVVNIILSFVEAPYDNTELSIPFV
jgi:hypothetical protein